MNRSFVQTVWMACGLLLSSCTGGDRPPPVDAPWPAEPPPAAVAYLIHLQDGAAFFDALGRDAPATAARISAAWGRARPEAVAMLDPRAHAAPLVLAQSQSGPDAELTWPGGAYGPRRIGGRRGVLSATGFTPYSVFEKGQRAMPARDPFVFLRLGTQRVAGAPDERAVALAAPWLLARPPGLPDGPALWFWLRPALVEEVLGGGEGIAGDPGTWWSKRLEPLWRDRGEALRPTWAEVARVLASLESLRAILWPEGRRWRLDLHLVPRPGSRLAAGLKGLPAGAPVDLKTMSSWGLGPFPAGVETRRATRAAKTSGLDLHLRLP